MAKIKVAVTGGIGSGKSYVCRLFEKRGVAIYDCDRAAKRIMATSEKLQAALTEIIGKNVYFNGVLQKAVLASYLLESEEHAHKINSIVHPAVADDFIHSGYTWMECAILYSSGFDKLVDRVVCVTAPLETRVNRIIKRDGISREKALEWIARQMPQEEVMSRSDFIIENDGIQNLEIQVDRVCASLV